MFDNFPKTRSPLPQAYRLSMSNIIRTIEMDKERQVA